ncbi:hypothetical protein EXIGLDRAFT_234341 [Exidia glandulosa HHB12029]|uniref:DUF6533 domain-containing protein n=1 Tax=Exidia glandulosa HHB12029 TaxID=1314781 RepID=A0A165MK03_EXIGL|nr:hypothetical protein EXIGLDRAFT_234341 [Exidia glandulosa HHB12029]
MASPEEEAALQALVTGLQDGRICNYVAISGLTILVWDYLCTVDQERECMWGKRLGLLQCLFYANRYLPIAYQIVNVICFNLPARYLTDAVSTGWLEVFLQIQVISQYSIAAAIVAYRIWALYQTNRVVRIGIVCAWLASTVGITTLLIVSVVPDKVVAELPFGLRGCHGVVALPLLYTAAMPSLLFDSLAFVLALWKLLKQQSFISSMRGRTTNANALVYEVMLLDTTLYFVV